jgi:hypothetical protein
MRKSMGRTIANEKAGTASEIGDISGLGSALAAKKAVASASSEHTTLQNGINTKQAALTTGNGLALASDNLDLQLSSTSGLEKSSTGLAVKTTTDSSTGLPGVVVHTSGLIPRMISSWKGSSHIAIASGYSNIGSSAHHEPNISWTQYRPDGDAGVDVHRLVRLRGFLKKAGSGSMLNGETVMTLPLTWLRPTCDTHVLVSLFDTDSAPDSRWAVTLIVGANGNIIISTNSAIGSGASNLCLDQACWSVGARVSNP